MCAWGHTHKGNTNLVEKLCQKPTPKLNDYACLNLLISYRFWEIKNEKLHMSSGYYYCHKI